MPYECSDCRRVLVAVAGARCGRCQLKREHKSGSRQAVAVANDCADAPLPQPGPGDPDLILAYRFLMSFTGDPNLLDSFKKYDPRARELPEGPAREAPPVLACLGGKSQTNRNAEEMRTLSTAFCEMIDALRDEKGPVDEEPDVLASWLEFKKAPPSYGEFAAACSDQRDTIVKLARIAALYWYSDTGDVLMNAFLRNDDFSAPLKKRVEYLAVDYGEDHQMIARLPSAEYIDSKMDVFEEQIRAQVAMLKNALSSDLLKRPDPGTPLYRGMALLPKDVGDKFEPRQTARLKGFSSSAADAHAAYHFMQTSASELNIMNPTDTATPIFYKIEEGAEHGRYLGSYSLHSGESEVLFDEGIYPTVSKKSSIELQTHTKPHRFLKDRTVTVTEPVFTDGDDAKVEGFDHAIKEYQKDRAGAELKSASLVLKKTKNPVVDTGYEHKSLKDKSEQALSEGGFAKLQWPQGNGIMLVTARMG